MAILIDGYNLLHAAGIIPRGVGRGTLERARQALLNWLVRSLDRSQLGETTVVFDAANPPPGRPREFNHRGVTVLFSTEHDDADAMIEELIRGSTAPKQLVVVSSDHRVQRAARRRRARPVDSDVWYFELARQRDRPAIEPPAETKPAAPLTEAEVEKWLDEFGDLLDGLDEIEATLETPPVAGRGARDKGQVGSRENVSAGREPVQPEEDEERSGGDSEPLDADLANPFPPGYGEDLLRPDADLEG